MRADGPDPEAPPLEGSRASDAVPRFSNDPADAEWISRARDSYRASDDWFNSSLRKQAEANLAHFRSKHRPGSKYNSELYQKKSHVFRPKTRSMVRRSDAAMAIAFFSTQDVVNVAPVNESNPAQRVAATVHGALLNYRLENTIPWFITAVGASQDAAVNGVVISKQYWERQTRRQRVANVYEEEDGSTTIDISTEEQVLSDQPRVKLIALENFRIDPAADWTDPINSSPYCIELCPVYIYELLEGMDRVNPRTGRPEYRRYDVGVLQAALQQDWDSIRQMREGNRVDKYDQPNIAIDEYRTVWVHKSIYRVNGEDWYVETIGTELLLTDPELAEDVFPHLEGKERPYSLGYASIEAHVAFPQSPVEMTAGLQEEINDVANLRLDNVKLAISKRWFVRRGMGVDVPTLVRNIPSSVVFMTDTAADVKEVASQDVTRSSYEEQDRLNVEFDDLGGSFSSASVASNRALNETVGGMSMLTGDASQIQEFQVRTICETWAERVMRHLVRLEATHETDEDILMEVVATSGLPLELIQQTLHHKTRVRVNVGFNATQPEKRIGKLMLAMDAVGKLMPDALQELDRGEIVKEIFGAVGYRDGSRFLPNIAKGGQEDPRIKQLQQQVQQLTQIIETKQVEQQGKIQVAQIGAQALLQRADMDNAARYELAMLETTIRMKEMELEKIDRILAGEGVDTKRKELMLQREALSHSINDDNREFLLKVQQAAQPQQPQRGAGGSKPKGAMNLPGNDKAGVISREQFGEIPQAAG